MAQPDNPLRQLERLGQSIWLDYIRRHLLDSPEFRRMLDEDGLAGMTSNPTIFEKAIGGSTDYDAQLAALSRTDKPVARIYEELSLEDIARAADALRPVYERTAGRDGFVSYEVSPELAADTEGSVAAARRYFAALGRPNVMIKVPATPQGIPAIEQLIAEGLNINITLMFSMRHYEAVAEAYLRGLERRVEAGMPVERVASVASVFVSRIDTLVDKLLDERLKAAPDEAVAALRGKAAVANSKLIYRRFKELFGGPRFARLGQRGARPQRVLWASTGTKNPAYSDIKYVAELIGPQTVNTLPPATMDAFRDHGQARLTVEEGFDEARETVARLKALGIDLDEVGERLQAEGVALFAKSFDDLLAVVKARREALVAGAFDRQSIAAGALVPTFEAALAELERSEFAVRLWRKDPTLWKKEPEHQQVIRNALGWLNVAELMTDQVEALKAFSQEVRADGVRHVVLLGMGGSSLCPEVLARTFASAPGHPELIVLDSSVPEVVRSVERAVELQKTLFIVSSKSGRTIETLSQYRYFFELLAARAGTPAGKHFVAITDPDTALAALAREKRFRRLFLNPADIGGRYSALSLFGLVPAALIGLDIGALLDRATRMAHSSAGYVRAKDNAGVSLGAALGACYRAGRDKLTVVASPPIASFGLWLEQLVAESTGKEGRGLVPVVDEPLGSPQSYGADRIFAYLRSGAGADPEQDRALAALAQAGHPVITVSVADKIDLGEEFLRWEIATATAGAIIGINAFDQPNVQESKDNTERLLRSFEQHQVLPVEAPLAVEAKLELHAPAALAPRLGAAGLAGALKAFAGLARPGDYFALMAYVAPSARFEAEMARIRSAVRRRLSLATTFGYGPRFLHSTGQLHKGGPNTGLFVQITQEHDKGVAIPGQSYDFAVLNQAQSIGDFEALSRHGRRVVRVHLKGDAPSGAAALAEALAAALDGRV